MRKIWMALVFSLTASLFAQTGIFSRQYKISNNNFSCENIVPAFDRGLLCAGGSWTQKLYVMKTDSAGNVVWTKTYGFLASQSFLTDVCRTSDSCYVVTGVVSNDLLFMKIKVNGDTVWVKKILGTAIPRNSIQQTKDKGFIVTGHGATIIKLDSLGNLQWKQFIDAGTNMPYGITTKQLHDSSYVLLTNKSVTTSTGYTLQTSLVNLTKTGNFNWAKSYNKSSLIDNSGFDMEVVEDGIVVFMNVSASDPIGLLKADFLGNVVWCKTYPGGPNPNFGDQRSIEKLHDKGFVFGTDRIIRTDSIGIPLWINIFNGPQPHTPYEFVQTKNKNIASISWYAGSTAVGETHIITMDTLGNSAACTQSVPTSVWFEGWVATPFTPTLISGGSGSGTTTIISSTAVSSNSGCPPPYPWNVTEMNTGTIGLQVSPNPSQGIYSLSTNENCFYTILDLTGKFVEVGKCETKALIDISNKANGIYILQITDANGKPLDTRKLIKK